VLQNPALVEALVRDRVAELRRSAGADARSRRAKRPHRAVKAARQTTGWLLVDMGLRLAVPRGTVSHPLGRGQR
jgi:hypothetical protein